MTAERFPLAPLEAILTIRHGPFEGDHCHQLARLVGVTERTIYRARMTGLTVWQADRYAIAAGLHPALIWPNWLRHPEAGCDVA
jgi:hypothetical protein